MDGQMLTGTVYNCGVSPDNKAGCWVCGGLVMVTIDDSPTAGSRTMARCQKCGVLQPERPQTHLVLQYEAA